MSYTYNQKIKAKRAYRKANPIVEEIPIEVSEKIKKEIPEQKLFHVTFTKNSISRTVTVKTTDKQNAERIAHETFGSYKQACIWGKPKWKWPVIPSNKITISSCHMVDADGNIIPDVVDEISSDDKMEAVAVNNATEAEIAQVEKPKRSRKKKSDATYQSLEDAQPSTI